VPGDARTTATLLSPPHLAQPGRPARSRAHDRVPVPLINPQLINLHLEAGSKDEAVRALAERLVDQGRVTDLDGFLADIAAREEQMPTGLEGGIDIPHARSAHVTHPSLAFGRSPHGVDFGATDGPADLIFLIAAPAGADDTHLQILSSLARRLMNPDFTAALRSATDAASTAALIRGDEAPGAPGTPGTGSNAASATDERATADASAPGTTTPGTAVAPAPPPADTSPITDPDSAGTPIDAPAAPSPDEGQGKGANKDAERPFRIVAVTSCPTGIAHTSMAAESLEQAGPAAGAEVIVESQGSAGFTRLDPAVIAAADGVIFAHDVPVREEERFAGKPTVDVGVKAGINRPAELIAQVRGKAERGEVTTDAKGGTPVERAGEPGDGYGTRLRKWLMSGVSHMVPFVAAGGLLIARGFAIGGYEINGAKSVTEHFDWGQVDGWGAGPDRLASARTCPARGPTTPMRRCGDAAMRRCPGVRAQEAKAAPR
jgi:PTS system fructose-specific IIC component